MPNSKHYLLGFWAALVSPVILLQDKAPKALESFIQQARRHFFRGSSSAAGRKHGETDAKATCSIGFGGKTWENAAFWGAPWLKEAGGGLQFWRPRPLGGSSAMSPLIFLLPLALAGQADVQRARQSKPRSAYKGEDQSSMSRRRAVRRVLRGFSGVLHGFH